MKFTAAFCVGTLLMTMSAIAAPKTASSVVFKGFTSLAGFSEVTPFGAGEKAFLSPEIEAGTDFNEFVASWDAQAGPGGQVSVCARAIYPDHKTKFYVMSVWSPDPMSANLRTSIDGQKDDDGTVDTDTLELNNKANKIQLLILAKPGTDGVAPNLNFLGLSFCDTTALPPTDEKQIPEVAPIDVPQKCQMDYPNGGGYCSPTSVSMVLNYWAQKLNRPEMAKDVPDVVNGVYDSAFKGTGNWPFNTAFAGTFPGIRAYITRFSSLDEVYEWVSKGFPVITSGSLPLMEGKPRPKGDPGHLVVLVGFTKDGDPIFNDPGRSQVRRTYKRADFEKAWDVSKRTVYLIYPETMTPPTDTLGHWYTGL